MKTIQTIISFLALSIFAISCSKDDDAPAPIKPISDEVSFENTTALIIRDALDGVDNNPAIPSSTTSSISVTEKGNLLNLKKLIVEMNIEHNYTKDLSFILIAPDGSESLFVYRVGGGGKFISFYKLRFSATFTNIINNNNSQYVVPGDYKESKGTDELQSSWLPIFSSLQGTKIDGIWQLKVTDHLHTDTGKIISWKIIFKAGALNQ